MKRREFLSRLAAAAVLPLLPHSAAEARAVRQPSEQQQPEERPHWTNTIFLQSEDAAVLSALRQYLDETGCYVREGERNSPDIIATPYFAAVVDRDLVGIGNWESYREYRREVNDRTLCIVVDDKRERQHTAFDGDIVEIAQDDPDRGKMVVELIKQHRRSYLNR